MSGPPLSGLLLQSGVQPDASAVNTWLEFVAWGTFLFIVLGLLVAIYIFKLISLDSEQRRQLKAIRPQLLSSSPEKTHIHFEDSEEERRRKVAGVLDGETPDAVRVRQAARELKADLAESFSFLPLAVARGISEVIGLLLVASLLAVSIWHVDGWLGPGSGSFAPVVEGIAWVISIVVLVVMLAIEIIGAIPGGGLVLTLLSGLRDPGTGATVAFLFAGLIAGMGVLLARQDEDMIDEVMRDVPPSIQVLRTAFWLAKVFGGITLAVLSFFLVWDGHLVRAIDTLRNAGPVGWLLLVGSPIIAAKLVGYLAPGPAADIRTAIRRSLNSVYVRAELLVVGAPVLVVVLSLLILSSFFDSIVAGVIGAVILGIIARGVTWIYGRVRYRFVDLLEDDPRLNEVVVKGTVLDDADGDPIYLLEVDGHKLAHRDRGELVDTGVAAASWRLDGPDRDRAELTAIADLLKRTDPPRHLPAVESYYHEAVTDRGEVDFDEVLLSLRSDCETRIEATLREANGEKEAEPILRELRDAYPEDVVDQSVAWLRDAGKVYRNQGKLILRQ